VGGGVAGLFTAWFMHQENKHVIVYNDSEIASASGVAAGLINPITGMRFAKTWMADAIFPFAASTYSAIEKTLGVSFFQPIPILRLADSVAHINDWEARAQSDAFKQYVSAQAASKDLLTPFHKAIGGFYIMGGAKINAFVFLNSLRAFFAARGQYISKPFSANEIRPNDVVVYCNGTAIKQTEGLEHLPILPVKGHYLVCAIPGLQPETVVQGKASIIPQGDGLYRVGSTYQWTFADDKAEEEQVELLQNNLRETTSLPFELKDVLVGIRPTTKDRRPILGAHPTQANTFVFNGLGTKGYSLAPYFAKQLCDFILHQKPILNEVDLARFAKSDIPLTS